MRNFTLKSGISRVCLISFILLCSVFVSQDAFSGTHWRKEFLNIKYDPRQKSINFDFLFYDNTSANLKDAFLERCIFEYSEDGVKFRALIGVRTSSQKNDHISKITMFCRKPGQEIRFLNCVKPKSGTTWTDTDNVNEMEAYAKVVEGSTRVNGNVSHTLRSYMTIEWRLPSSVKQIKIIRIRGNWKVLGIQFPDKIDQIYPTVDNLNYL